MVVKEYLFRGAEKRPATQNSDVKQGLAYEQRGGKNGVGQEDETVI